jgi:hypothetical protein
VRCSAHTTTSAAICQPIPTPYDAGSMKQADRLPRAIRATFPAYTGRIYVPIFRMVSGFECPCPLAQMRPPHIRNLYVGPQVCLQLPSDSTSRWTSLLFGWQFPPSGPARDFHPQVHEANTTAAPLALTRYAPCLAHKEQGRVLRGPAGRPSGEGHFWLSLGKFCRPGRARIALFR